MVCYFLLSPCCCCFASAPFSGLEFTCMCTGKQRGEAVLLCQCLSGWPGLPWINCYGAYWSKLMQAFRHKEGAWCRKRILLQCAAPITIRALAFRVISLHSKPTAQCAVSAGRCCLAFVVRGEACQKGGMTSGCLFQLWCHQAHTLLRSRSLNPH